VAGGKGDARVGSKNGAEKMPTKSLIPNDIGNQTNGKRWTVPLQSMRKKVKGYQKNVSEGRVEEMGHYSYFQPKSSSTIGEKRIQRDQ